MDETTHSFSATETSEKLFVGMFRSEPRESGAYTFTLQALGDGKEYEDSATVTSEVFQYTKPSAQLAVPTNLRWDGSTARWDKVDNAVGYDVRWYYSATANGDFEYVGSVTTYWNSPSSNSEILSDWVLEDHGAGYYAFDVRAIAGDIKQICPSELSARSAVYSTAGATGSVSESLDSIMSGLGDNPNTDAVNEAVEAVKNLNTDELRVAMEADKDNSGVTAKIKDLEAKTNITVKSTVAEGISLDGDITLTGAALNAGENQTEGTFNITKPDQDKVVPAAYANAVQFDFGLDGAVTESNGDFAVPIKITMPVPEDIDPARLRILHYTASGDIEEVVFPAITEKAGKYYATFVVKHFSIFAFAEATTAAMIGETPYYSLQEAIDEAENGATIDLYRNSDDTALKVVDKDLEIHCGVYNLASDVKWTLVDCEKTETKDSDDHVVIKITRTGGSTGGGSSSGGGGGGGTVASKPSVSVIGTGGKAEVAADGTVIITPDEGYRIDSLTINGDEIQIPTDGKLTGLDKDDKVVVTFTKDTITIIGPFADVSVDAWYADAVLYVYNKGMMNGVSETSFAPDETTTRGMIVTMLHRLENEPAAGAPTFTDVASGAYYMDAVAWAAENGVVNGVSDTAFAPNSPITREQLAVILYRYAAYKGYDVTVGGMSLREYSDAAQISAYALEAMQWANSMGLITGDTATTLNPQGNATRAEVATMLMRFAENIA